MRRLCNSLLSDLLSPPVLVRFRLFEIFTQRSHPSTRQGERCYSRISESVTALPSVGIFEPHRTNKDGHGMLKFHVCINFFKKNLHVFAFYCYYILYICCTVSCIVIIITRRNHYVLDRLKARFALWATNCSP